MQDKLNLDSEENEVLDAMIMQVRDMYREKYPDLSDTEIDTLTKESLLDFLLN